MVALCYNALILKEAECVYYLPEPWDDGMKLFINENAQAFTSWLFSGAKVVRRLQTEFKRRKIQSDALFEVSWQEKPFLLHIEFQSTNDDEMSERMLEYNFEARRLHHLPVYSVVIYLRNDGKVPQSPLRWILPDGKEILYFYYNVVEMAELATEKLRQTGITNLLPMLLLTKDGARREVVEEIITGLHTTEKYGLLSVTELLASLVLTDETDQQWLQRRFAMLKDILRDTPAYQRILEEGLEAGLEKGLEKGFQRGRQETIKQELQHQRKALLNLLLDRFPRIVRRTKKYVDAIDDTEIMLSVIIKMATIQTAEEAEQLLAAVAGDDEETD